MINEVDRVKENDKSLFPKFHIISSKCSLTKENREGRTLIKELYRLIINLKIQQHQTQ